MRAGWRGQQPRSRLSYVSGKLSGGKAPFEKDMLVM